jgi:formylglycine-generating enzyme required for sulfatase activity
LRSAADLDRHDLKCLSACGLYAYRRFFVLGLLNMIGTVSASTKRPTEGGMVRKFVLALASLAMILAGFFAGYFVRGDVFLPAEKQAAGGQPTSVLPQVFRDCADCPEMVPVPGQAFAAGLYEVTRGQWAIFVEDTGRNVQPVQYESWTCDWHNPGFEQDDTHPVTCVSWYDAQAYVQWLSMRTGEYYRLLTSEEWQIAARAGANTKYWWGDQDPVCDQSTRTRNGANFSLCADDRTRPVGSFQPNGYGLYDVHGNVSEWVENCRAEGPILGYCDGPGCSAEGPIESMISDHSCGNDSYRAKLDGSWQSDSDHLRSQQREDFYWHPGLRDDSIGFRIARVL